MKDSETRNTIIQTTKKLLAMQGADDLSMRDIAHQSEVATSVLYYHFANKDELLRATFDSINTELGLARQQLPATSSASAMLLQRIEFQLEHMEEVVAVLKYYLAYRSMYVKEDQGVLPTKAYLHMLEVVEAGQASGEFNSHNVTEDAQVMTHAVNGFLLEYYPEPLSNQEQQMIANKLHRFLLRSLKGGETHELSIPDR